MLELAGVDEKRKANGHGASEVTRTVRDVQHGALGNATQKERQAWLSKLPHVSEDPDLRKIQAAVNVLLKPRRDPVFRICAPWGQAQKRSGQKLTLAVVVDELAEKVLDASRRAQHHVTQSGVPRSRLRRAVLHSLRMSTRTPTL